MKLRSRLVESLPEKNSQGQLEDDNHHNVHLDMSDVFSDSESSVQNISHTGELLLQPPSITGSISDQQTSLSASRIDASEFQLSRGDATMTDITAPSRADVLIKQKRAL